MDRDEQVQRSDTDEISSDMVNTTSGSATQDYGGMGRNIDQVDLQGANEVGADPPGGLPLDVAGGTQGVGRTDDDLPQDDL